MAVGVPPTGFHATELSPGKKVDARQCSGNMFVRQEVCQDCRVFVFRVESARFDCWR